MADRPRLGPLILELIEANRGRVGLPRNIREFYRRLYPVPPPVTDEDVSPTHPGEQADDTRQPDLPGDVIHPDDTQPPRGDPPPVTDAENYPYPLPPGTTAYLPRESRSPSRRSQHQLPGFAFHDSLLRTLGRAKPRRRKGSSEGSAARRRTPRARMRPPGLPGTSGLAGLALSFRGAPVRPPGLPGEPYPIVTDPRGPILYPSTRKQREGTPRTLEEALEQLHRTNPFDINPLPELKPPRRVIRPADPTVETAPDPLPMPSPAIPAPSPVQPSPLGIPQPSIPGIPMPRPPPPESAATAV